MSKSGAAVAVARCCYATLYPGPTPALAWTDSSAQCTLHDQLSHRSHPTTSPTSSTSQCIHTAATRQLAYLRRPAQVHPAAASPPTSVATPSPERLRPRRPIRCESSSPFAPPRSATHHVAPLRERRGGSSGGGGGIGVPRRALSTSSSAHSAWPAGTQAEDDHDQPGRFVHHQQASRTLAAVARASSAPSAAGLSGGAKTTAAASSSVLPPPPKQVTIRQLQKMKEENVPITCLTAYDYPSSLAIRAADIDICLVGDSLANVALGYGTTQRLSLAAMVHHVQAVHRGLTHPLLSASPWISPTPLLVADLPFGSFAVSMEQGVAAVMDLVKQGGADAVKIEGGDEVVPLISRLVSFGVPVMAHVGLQPQRVAAMGGYRLQGRTAAEAHAILRQALSLERAGAFAVVLECVPNRVGEAISRRLRVPTIGIGAGPETDGQVLVMNDMLGDLTSASHVLAGLEGDAHAAAIAAAEAEVGADTARSASGSAAASGGGTPGPGVDVAPEGKGSGDATKSTTTTQPSSSPAAPTPPPATPLPLASSSAPPPPKFVRCFASRVAAGATLGSVRVAAVRAYASAVRSGHFPHPEREGYKMRREEWTELRRLLAEEEGDGVERVGKS